MNRRDYWVEAVESSLEEAGVAATTEQIANVAGDMEISHQQEGMAFGGDVASANLQGAKERELADLRKRLRDEEAKVTCAECRGRGHIVENFGTRSFESTCSKCRGAGRHAP